LTIGRIAATLIKKHNCRVVGVARNEAKMLKFIEELGPMYKDQFSYKLFDVSSREACFYFIFLQYGIID